MIVTAALILMTPGASLDSPRQADSQNAYLGVTATVIRPLEISLPTFEGENVSIRISNADAVTVEAVGGTVEQLDSETIAVAGGASGSIMITISY